jgi:hypothetical protein
MGYGKQEFSISFSDLDLLIEKFEEKANNMPKLAENIANRIAEEEKQNVIIGANSIISKYEKEAYIKDTITEKAVLNGSIAVAYLRNNNQDATYGEFGTGAIGSRHPHPARDNWQYDVNEHGEKGRRYFREGRFHFTRGIPAHKLFYLASENARKNIVQIASEEIRKLNT